MNISRERLLREAEATGFRPQAVEKVIRLLNLLERIQEQPFLKGRLALKGGTALNLFCFDIPRLSVDIDLNYVGAADLVKMQEERPKVEQAIRTVCEREGLTLKRMPTEHAGGKWRLRYDSSLAESGALDLDVNFLCRIPLWPVAIRDSRPFGSYQAKGIPVLDIHELAAGKLAALLSRHASRDLFDTYVLFGQGRLDIERLRLGFVIYGAGSRKDWRTAKQEDVTVDAEELRNDLSFLLREDSLEAVGDIDEWADTLVRGCRDALGGLLPFSAQETGFLDALLDKAEIRPEMLTSDVELARRIKEHPLLNWKALNVRKHRRL